MSIRFGPSSSLFVIRYFGSDRAGCILSRRSTKRCAFEVAGGTISRRSKKRTIVALSSREDAYISLCAAAKKAAWLSEVLISLLVHISSTPICVPVTNQGFIISAEDRPTYARTKHIGNRHDFVHEAVRFKEIILFYCPGYEQAADVLAKLFLSILYRNCAFFLAMSPRTHLPD